MVGIRIFIGVVLLILGFVTPYWFFFFTLTISAIFFKNFWEAILITTVINIVYVYNNAPFQASYIAWGVAIYLVGRVVHSRTRFDSHLKEKK